MSDSEALGRVKRVGTGLCFMAFPMVLPRGQAGLLLVSVALVGFPDGAEIINLMAAVGMAGAMVPYGAGLLRHAPAPIGVGR